MKEADLKAALAAAFADVRRLNDMQVEMWRCPADRIVLLAPTGSGKTLAYAGAMLRRLGPAGRGLQAVVLAPSRELVIQIYEVVRRLGREYKAAAFYGRHSMTDEIGSLRGAPDIIVATPGRLLDHLQRGTLTAPEGGLRALVIDEYDKCLDLGFAEEMRRIVRRLGRPRAVVLTSATPIAEMPAYLDMQGAVTVATAADAAPAPQLHIAHVESQSRDKLDTLYELLASLRPEAKAIVFVNHRDAAERVARGMRSRGIPAGLYHGGQEQVDRERAVVMLDNGSTPVLVATDLAARGLDIDSVEAVVHYHMPPSPEAWTHRNGRTARAGAGGDVYVITSEADDIPPYVAWQHDYAPVPREQARSRPVTLYIDSGRREKISRADIVGFLTKQAGIDAGQIGKIDLRDHCAYVAVPRECLGAVAAVKGVKMKGRRVRISPIAV